MKNRNATSVLHQKLSKYRAMADNLLESNKILIAKNKSLSAQNLKLRAKLESLVYELQTDSQTDSQAQP